MSERLERAADELEIRAVAWRYCRAVDRRDYDLLQSCYHPDGYDENRLGVKRNPDDLIRYWQEESRSEWSVHFIGNQVVDLDGNVAGMESYCVTWSGFAPRPDRPEMVLSVGLRYCDRLERRHDVWRIVRRTTVFDWRRWDEARPDLPGELLFKKVVEAGGATRDLTDPSYEFLPPLAS